MTGVLVALPAMLFILFVAVAVSGLNKRNTVTGRGDNKHEVNMTIVI